MTQTKIYGLIGYPVEHSLSPRMHNAAFKALNIDAEYKLFEVKPENLEKFLLKDVFNNNIAGFNITIPHKVKAREILEREFPFDQKASLIQENLYYVKLSGAVNTVGRVDARLEYWNTDASGFLRSLKQDLDFDTKNKNVLLIGCGGAGRAIIAALSWKNVGIKKIYVNDISEEAIDSARQYFSQFPHLSDKVEFIVKDDIPKAITDCELLVNASPIGMKGEDGPVVDSSLLHKGLYVYDIVYNRNIKTQLFRDAESYGLKVADGLSMLLWQGVDAFEIWTGQKAPIEVMRKSIYIRG